MVTHAEGMWVTRSYIAKTQNDNAHTEWGLHLGMHARDYPTLTNQMHR
jgi:hypothetical protein